MAAVIDIENTSVVGSVLAGIMPFPLPQPQLQEVVHLAFPDFRFHLAGYLIDFLSEVKEGRVKAKVTVIELRGNLDKSETYFKHEAIFLRMKVTRESAAFRPECGCYSCIHLPSHS